MGLVTRGEERASDLTRLIHDKYLLDKRKVILVKHNAPVCAKGILEMLMILAHFLQTSYNITALESTANCCLPSRLRENCSSHIHSNDQQKLFKSIHLKNVNFSMISIC